MTLAFAPLTVFLTELGLAPRLARELAARPTEGQRLYASSLGSKLLMLPLALAAGLVLLSGVDPSEPRLCLLMWVWLGGGPFRFFLLGLIYPPYSPFAP